MQRIGKLGHERYYGFFIQHLCDIFDEVKRLLKAEGTFRVNLGDTGSPEKRPAPVFT